MAQHMRLPARTGRPTAKDPPWLDITTGWGSTTLHQRNRGIPPIHLADVANLICKARAATDYSTALQRNSRWAVPSRGWSACRGGAFQSACSSIFAVWRVAVRYPARAAGFPAARHGAPASDALP